ncbi:uncharacterized protein LOC112085266 [Eutrema salsugineum]|uniref:uncharacterized protein LOC112085266 n=1 Tax=Eutrema salsugineum TaxID=72664 RepID=UPI000CED3C2E|nr:uncharacterized protein LOC112085266 [Eutrema salsugineum]
METMKELVAVQKPLLLQSGNFGHWKARMRHIIRGIDEDAWTAVEQDWTAPTVVSEDKEGNKITIDKPKNQWTETEKSLSKFNSKAMSAIFAAVDLDEFGIIQGCESAKEAWDTCFTTKLNTIANESAVLGKKFKDKKLVKKLLRCLPPKFAAHKAVVKYSMDTDTMKFEKLVGLLKAEEMEANADQKTSQKSIAFTAADEKDRMSQCEENLSLLARNFNKMLKKVEKGHNKFTKFPRNEGEKGSYRNTRTEGDRGGRKRDLQCHECEGFGHFRSDCPLTKRKKLKCPECKGFGHTKSECPNALKSKDKSMIVFEDSESEDEEEDNENLMLNFVAFTAEGKEQAQTPTTETDSESDEEEIDPKVEYRKLYDNWVKISTENLQLIKEKALMKAQINILEMEQGTTNTEKEQCVTQVLEDADAGVDKIKEELMAEQKKRRELEEKLDNLREVCYQEKERARTLQGELIENHKRIRMLNTGAEKLDQILSSGQPPKKNWGLGYTGGFHVGETSSVSGTLQGFVHGGISVGELSTRPAPLKEAVEQCNPKKNLQTVSTDQPKPDKRRKGVCFLCDKRGHKKRNCYKFWSKIKQAWKRHLCYPEPRFYGKVWVAKNLLYDLPSQGEVAEPDLAEVNLVCNLAHIGPEVPEVVSNVAYTSSQVEVAKAWYFDSGCSRHMTGNHDYFNKIKRINGGQVTFGDGGQGKILGVGSLLEESQPNLINVYYVEGLKANLISVSQLCDEGLKVIFTRFDRKAVDENGNTVLFGVRSGNNCYMWCVSDQCFSAKESQLDLWHKRIGHMNTRGLSKLAKAEVVRGIPSLEASTDTVCETEGKATESFKILALQLKTEKGPIIQIRSDHGGEFRNDVFEKLCQSQGIRHQYSAPRTPQQNGVVERKNRTLQEMARAMLHGNKVSPRFWAEAINTACYIINRVYVKHGTKTTPYEIWNGKTPNRSYFHIFGCVCYILNDKDNLGKFDSRSNTGIFLGYATNSRAFRVYNYRTKTIGENINVVFDDNSQCTLEEIISDDVCHTDIRNTTPASESNESITEHEDQIHDKDDQGCDRQVEVHRNHSASDLIGDLHGERITRKKQIDFKAMVKLACFISFTEPMTIAQALQDEFWVASCHEELEQFVRLDVWDLVPPPDNVNVVGTKWIFKNKTDEEGNVIPCKMNIMFYQMDVKSAFLNGILQEEVYVAQPKGFEDPAFPNHAGFTRGGVDKTLFVQSAKQDILIVQIYVDDIIFGATHQNLVNQFVTTMTTEFQMSMVGELNYFLGLQIKQTSEGIFVSQSTYAKNLVKRFDMQTSRVANTPMSTTRKLSRDDDGPKIGQGVWMIKRAPQAAVSSLAIMCPGTAKSRNVFRCQQQRQNT